MEIMLATQVMKNFVHLLNLSKVTYSEAPSKSHEKKSMKLALVAPGQDSRDLNRNE
jgi:hypothetical protein